MLMIVRGLRYPHHILVIIRCYSAATITWSRKMTDQPTQDEYIVKSILSGEAWEPSRSWLSDTHVGRLSNEREGNGLERFNRLVREGRQFIARAFAQDESPLDSAKLGEIEK